MKRSDLVYKLLIEHAYMCPDMRELTVEEASKLVGVLEYMGMKYPHDYDPEDTVEYDALKAENEKFRELLTTIVRNSQHDSTRIPAEYVDKIRKALRRGKKK